MSDKKTTKLNLKKDSIKNLKTQTSVKAGASGVCASVIRGGQDPVAC